MRRAERLLLIARLLNAARGRVVTAQRLAQDLEVSPRTIYRDVETLRAGGAPIDGERGVGYRLIETFTLPAMGLSPDELDALALGLRTVEKAGDPALARSAVALLDKLTAAMSEPDRAMVAAARLYAPSVPDAPPPGDLSIIRAALRERRKLRFDYVDRNGAATARVTRPVALSYLGTCWILIAWCERREDHRSFRTDRISAATLMEARIPHMAGPAEAQAIAPWI